MKKVEVLLADSLVKKRMNSLYIATNAKPPEAAEIKKSIESHLPVGSPARVVVGLKGRIPLDTVEEEIVLEQVVLWCAGVFYETPFSSWISSMDRMTIKGCQRPQEVGYLPNTGPQKGSRILRAINFVISAIYAIIRGPELKGRQNAS